MAEWKCFFRKGYIKILWKRNMGASCCFFRAQCLVWCVLVPLKKNKERAGRQHSIYSNHTLHVLSLQQSLVFMALVRRRFIWAIIKISVRPSARFRLVLERYKNHRGNFRRYAIGVACQAQGFVMVLGPFFQPSQNILTSTCFLFKCCVIFLICNWHKKFLYDLWIQLYFSPVLNING